ncbi:MAG: redox-sensing transcriptional repressor Rex [Porphyromonas sp.]|nr:redox-sensing transcriptional repressor Rex [Porphyromonas sp.]
MSNKIIRPIPEPTLRRLPWYLSHVKLQYAQGQRYISSTAIAQGVGVEQSVVAKDLSCVNIQGRTRVGYQTQMLIEVLEEFLGFTEQHKAVLVGAGSLGSALLSDRGLQHFGLEIVAGFDVNPECIGQCIADIPIYHIDELARIKEQYGVRIAILTVPIRQAQETTDMLAGLGFSAVWNFTPVRIKVPEGMVVQNTSMYAHLALIFTRLKEQETLRKGSKK